MTPMHIEYGQRYADDSGWERQLKIDMHENSARIDLGGGNPLGCSLDDLWWLVRAAMRARDHLGMDRIVPEGAVSAGEKHG